MEIIIIAALGGLIPVYLVSLLVGRIFFKNTEMKKKILYSTLISYVVAIIISGFGNANGGPFNPMYIEYALSAITLIGIRNLYFNIKNKKSE
jgi:hypothetical protein